jgi:hypothetical protein
LIFVQRKIGQRAFQLIQKKPLALPVNVDDQSLANLDQGGLPMGRILIMEAGCHFTIEVIDLHHRQNQPTAKKGPILPDASGKLDRPGRSG